jgi:hypothetical protein
VYIDPSGYDPLDGDWQRQFWNEHGRWPTEQDKRDRLFSIVFLGSGFEGEWTKENWDFYHANRDDLWAGRTAWPSAEAPGLDRYVLHVRRLTSEYEPDEHREFVRAYAFVFGGIPHDCPWTAAAVSVAQGPHLWNPLHEGTEGWSGTLVDDSNPSHHYAGLFFLGYFAQIAPVGKAVNYARESDTNNRPDIELGNIAVDQGVHFRLGYSDPAPNIATRSYRAWISDMERALSVPGVP